MKKEQLNWTMDMVETLLQLHCHTHAHEFEGSKSAAQLNKSYNKIALALSKSSKCIVEVKQVHDWYKILSKRANFLNICILKD